MRIALDISCSLYAKLFLRTPLWNLLRKHDVTLVVNDRLEVFPEYVKEFGDAAIQIGNFRDCDTKGKWDVGVTGSGDASDQEFCWAIKKGGVPLVGVMEAGHYVWQRWHNCVLPDKFCVWGPWYTDFVFAKYLNKGVEFIITGQPRFDRYFGSVKNPRLTKALLGLPVNVPMVLFGIHESTEEVREWALRNLALVHKTEEINVAVKCKHHQDTRKWEKEFSDLRWFEGTEDLGNGYREIDYRVVLEDAIWACDVFVCMDSTLGLEAALIGKPVIDMDYGGKKKTQGIFYLQKWLSANEKYLATRNFDLNKMVKAVMQHPQNNIDMREPIIQAIHPFRDGKSSERVMEVIESCA